MNIRRFKPLVFFVGLVVGLFAVAIFWESAKPLPEFEVAPVVPAEETFEEFELEPPSGQNYDLSRYDQITSILRWISKNKKNRDSDVFAPFDQVSNLLSLENVRWDDVGVNADRSGQLRMYHFRGFYLLLYLEKRLSGESGLFSTENVTNKGVEYINGLPSLQIDGLNDPEERIRRLEKTLAESAKSFLEEPPEPKNE